MKKRFLTVFLIIILAFTNLTVSYADEINLDTLTDINIGSEVQDWAPQNQDGEYNWNDFDDVGGWGGKDADSSFGILKLVGQIISWIFMGVVQLLLSIVMFFCPHMDKIIFNDTIPQGWEGLMVDWAEYCRLAFFDTNVSTSSLAGNMRAAVSSFYQIFRTIAIIFFIIAISCIAVKMIISSIGKQKQQYKESLKNWLIGLVLLVVGHWLMIYLIYFSEWLVDVIVILKDTLITYDFNHLAADESANGSLQTIFTAALGDQGAITGGVFSIVVWAIVALISLIVYAAMNIKVLKIYIERVIIVGVLIMVFPIVTVFYAFEKGGLRKGSTFDTWLRTFIEQVYVQPIHALALTFVMLALTSIPLTYALFNIMGPIIVLMILNMVFSIENLIKKVISVQGAAMGAPKDALGVMAPFAGMAAGRVAGTIGKRISSAKGKGFGAYMRAIGSSMIDPLGAFGKNENGKIRPAKDFGKLAVDAGVKALNQGGLGVSGPSKKGNDDKKQKIALRITLDNMKKATAEYSKNKNSEEFKTFYKDFDSSYKKAMAAYDDDTVKDAKLRFPNLKLDSADPIEAINAKMALLTACADSNFSQGMGDINGDGKIDQIEFERILADHIKGVADNKIRTSDIAVAMNMKADISTEEIQRKMSALALRFGDELKDAILKVTNDMSDSISAINTPEAFKELIYALKNPDLPNIPSMGKIESSFNKELNGEKTDYNAMGEAIASKLSEQIKGVAEAPKFEIDYDRMGTAIAEKINEVNIMKPNAPDVPTKNKK